MLRIKSIRPIKERKLKGYDMEGVEVTDEYWDCECDKDYIHHASEDVCPVCGTKQDEGAPSRVSEVRKMLYAKARTPRRRGWEDESILQQQKDKPKSRRGEYRKSRPRPDWEEMSVQKHIRDAARRRRWASEMNANESRQRLTEDHVMPLQIKYNIYDDRSQKEISGEVEGSVNGGMENGSRWLWVMFDTDFSQNWLKLNWEDIKKAVEYWQEGSVGGFDQD